jgi:hypothetical protein
MAYASEARVRMWQESVFRVLCVCEREPFESCSCERASLRSCVGEKERLSSLEFVRGSVGELVQVLRGKFGAPQRASTEPSLKAVPLLPLFPSFPFPLPIPPPYRPLPPLFPILHTTP